MGMWAWIAIFLVVVIFIAHRSKDGGRKPTSGVTLPPNRTSGGLFSPREGGADREVAAVSPDERWRGDPATQKQIDYIESLGGSVPRAGLTKGEASAVIDSLQPADEEDLRVLRFFKVSTRGMRLKSAKEMAESLLANPGNAERWAGRSPSSGVKEFFRFFGEKLPPKIGHDDAQALMNERVKELATSSPDRLAEWNSYDVILDNFSDPDFCEGYDIKKPPAPLLRKVVDGLISEGRTYEQMADDEEEIVRRLIAERPELER